MFSVYPRGGGAADSGTICVPVGGSPVQSQAHILWEQSPGVQGGGAEEEPAPRQVHRPPPHFSPTTFLFFFFFFSHNLPNSTRVRPSSLEGQKEGDCRLATSHFVD